MDILFVGSDAPGALERYCASALREMGHTVSYYDLHEEFIRFCRFRQTPVLNELEQKLWLGRYNKRLIRRIEESHADLVLIFKGKEIRPDTLQHILKIPDRPILANWNPDNPFDSSVSNTGRDLIESIKFYDHYFIWDVDLFQPLQRQGAKQINYLPFGYDPAFHHPVDLTDAERKTYQSDICFVGGYTPERAELLDHLFDKGKSPAILGSPAGASLRPLLAGGVSLGIWGPNWHLLPASHRLHQAHRSDWIHGVELSKVFSAAGIVMNFIREQNGQAHNMRTFEAPATGALMLSTRTRDQMGWLPEGEGAAYFESQEEMVKQAEHLLKHPEERAKIATKGYSLITTGKQRYADRMAELINVIGANR